MLVYPQLATGALSQYPVQKKRQRRTVVNAAADGSAIKVADPGVVVVEWELRYAELTDDEKNALEQFFLAAEGSLNGFTFPDPVGNLLAWSGTLDHAEWEKDPLLTVAQNADGTWRLTNAGAAAQSICQTVEAPGDYLYCLSVYARAAVATTVTLLRDAARRDAALGAEMARIAFAGNGTAAAGSVRFGLELPAMATVDVCGFQVETQASASGYKATTEGGVYEGARFRDDELDFVATDVNRHSATVNIIHAKHL
jgi:hypothetical protein